MSEKNIETAISVLFEGEMTEQGLTELRARFPVDVVHDMTNEAEFKAARKIRTELNKLLEAIKTRRINVTSEIKTKGDDLTAEVELIYSTVVGPYKAQLEVNRIAKEKAELELKELLDKQRIDINNMNNFVNDCIGASSKSISECIEAIENIEPSMFHKDIIHEAIEVKGAVKNRLGELLYQAIGEEALQSQREELAKKQEEADEQKRIDDEAKLIEALKAKAQERLNKLMMIPTGFFGKPSGEINEKIKSLESYEVLESEFGELFNPANAAKQQVIIQLTTMHDQQLTVESVQAATKESERVAKIKSNDELLKQREQQAKSYSGDIAKAQVMTGDALDPLIKEMTKENHLSRTEPTIGQSVSKSAPSLSKVAEIELKSPHCEGLAHEAYEAHKKAEQKWYAYACELPLGDERIRAFEVYENIRTATRRVS
tara:strand:- start:46 stop:1338 length:1293 start_codon:yes stop_codon:yes gene_type:complete